ncbi:STAS domain-containing protein [Streptomyces sp. NPDC046915]|uniref:STAS domain-containing protein n=1 Tax=Streptomyces sp. NPDC046915 TaxID=3155257 RepID=UPI0033CFF78D
MPEPAPRAQPLMAKGVARTDSGSGTPFVPCRATLAVVRDGTRMGVVVRGELDFDADRWLRHDLDDALRRSVDGITLDLSAVDFCDCAGLGILLTLRKRALQQGKTVTIRAGSPTVERLLDLTGAGELFEPPGPLSDRIDTVGP